MLTPFFTLVTFYIFIIIFVIIYYYIFHAQKDIIIQFNLHFFTTHDNKYFILKLDLLTIAIKIYISVKKIFGQKHAFLH